MNNGSGSYRINDYGQRVQLSAPESPSNPLIEKPFVRLWTNVLTSLHKDLVRQGEGGEAYRDAVQAEDELEMVASMLGCRRGFITRMIDEAIAEHARKKQARHEYDQQRKKSE